MPQEVGFTLVKLFLFSSCLRRRALSPEIHFVSLLGKSQFSRERESVCVCVRKGAVRMLFTGLGEKTKTPWEGSCHKRKVKRLFLFSVCFLFCFFGHDNIQAIDVCFTLCSRCYLPRWCCQITFGGVFDRVCSDAGWESKRASEEERRRWSAQQASGDTISSEDVLRVGKNTKPHQKKEDNNCATVRVTYCHFDSEKNIFCSVCTRQHCPLKRGLKKKSVQKLCCNCWSSGYFYRSRHVTKTRNCFKWFKNTLQILKGLAHPLID